MRKSSASLLSLFVVALIVFVPYVISPLTVNATTVVCQTDNHTNVDKLPKGSALVLNINWVVINDEDSGLAGYWALDHYVKTLKVWLLPNGTWFGNSTYSGNFITPQGAISPGTNAATEVESGYGTFKGCYAASWSGIFNPSGGPTSGSLGVKNYGGTTADVLKGTYGNGQVGPTSVFDWRTTYFPTNSGFTLWRWGWTYTLNPAFTPPATATTWNNFLSGNSGDIVT